MPESKHILVIRFSAMGDVAMTVPVLRALTEQYPYLKITVVTREFFRPIFQDLKNVEVYSADLKDKHKGVFGLFKLSKKLKRLKFDAVADLHNVLRSKILKTFFLGKKVEQLDKGRTEKKALIKGEKLQQLKTTHQRYADVFNALGFSIDLSDPKFPHSRKLDDNLSQYFADKNLQTIGIAPFAAHISKMYPLVKMKQVISKLSKNYNIILFGGGEKETAILRKIENEHTNTTSVAGKLSLEEELQIISNIDLMVSMDSGNGHLAAMLGIKVLTIWGVTHPFAGFGPFNQPLDFSILAEREQYPKIPTSVYGNKYPQNYKDAAGSITVEDVVKKVNTILNN